MQTPPWNYKIHDIPSGADLVTHMISSGPPDFRSDDVACGGGSGSGGGDGLFTGANASELSIRMCTGGDCLTIKGVGGTFGFGGGGALMGTHV